jgi:hypothetical protein
MLITVVMWAAVAAVIAFVGWPLLHGTTSSVDLAAEVLPPLERQKLEAYTAIKEAEFDRRMDKLSEEDFAALTQRYRQQALDAIAAIDEARRAVEVPRKAARTAQVRFAFCPSCGTRLPPRARFCTACGHALRDTDDGSRETGVG